MDGLYTSAKWSLYCQLLFGMIAFLVLLIPIPARDKVLWDVLLFDTIVQVIELLFYVWLTFSYVKIQYDITSTRYLDWFITTPIMLITTIIFIIYLRQREGIGNSQGIWEMIKQEWKPLGMVVMANALMLLFGLFGELNILPRFICFIIGFCFFFYTFYIIYINYVKKERGAGIEVEKKRKIDNKKLIFPMWLFMFLVWGIYGVAYLFPYQSKNILYNILDVFSKNFYGFFVAFYILFLIK